jgi:hypothetical protein
MIKDVEGFASGLEYIAETARLGEIIVETIRHETDISEQWGADGYKHFLPNGFHTVTFTYRAAPKKQMSTPIEHLIERLKRGLL